MLPIYQAENLFDAHLVRGRLESEGLRATVRGEYLAGAMGELPMSGLIAVCVEAGDVETALQLLGAWAEERRAAAATGEDAQARDDDPDTGAVLA